jgi:hypothetical protein
VSIRIPESEIWDAIEDGTRVATSAWRWGTNETYVVEREPGRFYRFMVQVHAQEGLQTNGPVLAVEVREVEKVVKVWEPVATQSESVEGESK